jgi:hypothetical protein
VDEKARLAAHRDNIALGRIDDWQNEDLGSVGLEYGD